MRQYPPILTGVAAIGLLLTATPNAEVSATTLRVAAAPRIHVLTFRQTAPEASPRRMAATGCSGTGTPNFTGYGGANQATTNYAGVAAGSGNSACQTSSFIGGGQANIVGVDSNGANSFIGAGYSNTLTGSSDGMVAGAYNSVTADYGFAGAGSNNTISGAYSGSIAGASNNPAGAYSLVGAGLANSVTGNGSVTGGGGYIYVVTDKNSGKTASSVSGTDSFLGAGDLDTIEGNQDAIGAGQSNNIGGSDSFVGSGYKNSIDGNDAVIAGGISNSIASNGSASAILGGTSNEVLGQYGAVLGGYGNNSTGEYSIVAGGDLNESLGTLSFAAGYHAHATKNGSFVWADYSSGQTLADTAANQFRARASGGFFLYSNAAATAGVELAPGSGAWANLSDRNSKTNIVPLDDDAVLAKVAALPVSSWSYKTENGVKHLGPMAQDFYAAFGAGPDSRHITSIDEDGVALSAIKSLNAKVASLEAKVDRKDREIDAILSSRASRERIR